MDAFDWLTFSHISVTPSGQGLEENSQTISASIAGGGRFTDFPNPTGLQISQTDKILKMLTIETLSSDL